VDDSGDFLNSGRVSDLPNLAVFPLPVLLNLLKRPASLNVKKT
jgi:hypothetical protein